MQDDTIEIMNMKRQKPVTPYDFVVDRSSKVGNPFILKTERDRAKVCEEYEKYFALNKGDPQFVKVLAAMLAAHKKYGKLRLFCWCAPKRCHAETIKKHMLGELFG